MNRKDEKLSLDEIGIIAGIVLILSISLLAIWFNGSTATKETRAEQSETVDTSLSSAEKAVKKLENSSSEADLKAAQAAVDKLQATTAKESLQKRIDTVKQAIAKQKEVETQAKLKAEKIRAEETRKYVEEHQKDQAADNQTEPSQAEPAPAPEVVIEQPVVEEYYEVPAVVEVPVEPSVAPPAELAPEEVAPTAPTAEVSASDTLATEGQ